MYLKIILLQQQQLSIHKIVKKKKCSINIFVTPFSLKKMNKRRKNDCLTQATLPYTFLSSFVTFIGKLSINKSEFSAIITSHLLTCHRISTKLLRKLRF